MKNKTRKRGENPVVVPRAEMNAISPELAVTRPLIEESRIPVRRDVDGRG